MHTRTHARALSCRQGTALGLLASPMLFLAGGMHGTVGDGSQPHRLQKSSTGRVGVCGADSTGSSASRNVAREGHGTESRRHSPTRTTQ